MEVSRRSVIGAGAIILFGGCVDPFSPNYLIWIDNDSNSSVDIDFRVSSSKDSSIVFTDEISLDADENKEYFPDDFAPGEYYFTLKTADGMEWGQRLAVSRENPYQIEIKQDRIEATELHID